MYWLQLLIGLNFGMAVLLGGGIAGFYYSLKYDKGESISSEVNSIYKQKQDIEEKIRISNIELKRVQEMDVVLGDLGGEINKFLKFIPSELTSSMVLNRLNEYAKVAGVNMEDITNYSATEKKDFYEKIKISVTIKGVYTQALVFLSKLTGSTEIITVEDFTIKKAQQKGKKVEGFNEVIMRMDIYGYRYTAPIVSTQAKSEPEKKK